MVYIIFIKTTDVFAGEELLLASGMRAEVVPTPVQDKAYCGVCLKIAGDYETTAVDCLGKLEYCIVKGA